jgi:hypothetical protein
MHAVGDHDATGTLSGMVDRLVWHLPDSESAFVNGDGEKTDRKCKASTYLELPADTILSDPSFQLENGGSQVVLDLGAGVGKIPGAAVLVHGARKGVGVELSPTRYHAGCDALQRLATWVADDSHVETSLFRSSLVEPVQIELRLEDVLETDLSEIDRIIIFATCFPTSLTRQLQRRMTNHLPVGARVFIIGANKWEAQPRAPTPAGASSPTTARALEPLLTSDGCNGVETDDLDNADQDGIADHVWILRG